MIDSKEISVVVQGAIDKNLTQKCLNSIRLLLPKSVIILSTWEGSDAEGLNYDVLIKNKDPGAELCDLEYNIKNNVNRQILSTKNGLMNTTTKYALKLRSDIVLKNNNFLKYFTKFDNFRNKECKIFKNRIIINNLYCANRKKTNFLFHISDWVQFGLTEDIFNLWDIQLQKEPETSKYFLNKERPLIDPVSTWLFQYIPEQYIWKSCLEKNGIDIKFEYFTDLNERNIEINDLAFANNVVIVNYEEYGIKFLKFDPYKWDYQSQMDYFIWQKLYKKYCNNNYKISIKYSWKEKLEVENFVLKYNIHKNRLPSLKIFIREFLAMTFYLIATIFSCFFNLYKLIKKDN